MSDTQHSPSQGQSQRTPKFSLQNVIRLRDLLDSVANVREHFLYSVDDTNKVT